jgi:DNA-binding beta-propeller fold protein YncE
MLTEAKKNWRIKVAVALMLTIITCASIPFASAQINYVRKFGSLGSADGNFNYPGYLALDASGNIYVSDRNNNRVEKFDNAGNFLAKSGYINMPLGVAVDKNSNYIYVLTSSNIIKLSSSLSSIATYCSSGSNPGQLNNPRCITVDQTGNLYVTDFGNSRVEKFNSNGQLLLNFGKPGSEDGNFTGPFGIALDSNGNIYVSENTGRRVSVFDGSGNFLYKFGAQGNGNGNFYAPTSIAIDANNHIFVLDASTHLIQQFNSNHEFVLQYGGSSIGTAFGLDVDVNGYIYLADTSNNQIQILYNTLFTTLFVAPELPLGTILAVVVVASAYLAGKKLKVKLT